MLLDDWSIGKQFWIAGRIFWAKFNKMRAVGRIFLLLCRNAQVSYVLAYGI